MIITVEVIATTASTVAKWTAILLLVASGTEPFIRTEFIPSKATHLQSKRTRSSCQIFPWASPQKF